MSYMPPKQDEEDLIQIRQYLKSYGYEPSNIVMDCFILFDKITGELQDGIYKTLTKEQVQNYTVHRPDIIVKKQNTIRFIVEVDGSAHDTKPGRKRTFKRNEDYGIAGIEYIEINKSDLKLMKWSIEDYLHKSVLKIERDLLG